MPILEQYGATYPGSTPLAQGTYQPVTVLSSTNGQQAFNDNTQTLNNLQSSMSGTVQQPTGVQYTFKPLTGGLVDILENGKSIAQGGPGFSEEYAKSLGYVPAGPLKGGSNPATNTMVNGINGAVSKGGLTASEQEGLTALQKTQDGLVSATAQAQAAMASKDYPSMDFHVQRAKDLQKQYADMLAAYYQSVQPLREQRAKLLTPTDKERQLNTRLEQLRKEAENFDTQTEEDKYNEYQGQTLGFAGGRAAEIDMRAEFKRKRYASDIRELLADIGYEQKARELERSSIAEQLGYISDDFDLQSKIQEKLTAIEDDLYEQADKLSDDAKSTLMSILDKMGGVNPAQIPADSLAELETIAARAGIPWDLVEEALAVQYQQQTFENALKTRQEDRLSDNADDANGVSLTPEDKRILTGAGFAPADLEHIESGIQENGFQAVYDAEKAAGASKAQLDALAKVYGVAQKVTREQLSTTITQKMAQDGLREAYTDDELSTLARDSGFAAFFTGKAGEVENFLNSDKAKELYIDLLYKQYAAQGMAE